MMLLVNASPLTVKKRECSPKDGQRQQGAGNR
jgi:hypothetical protein